MCPTCHFNNLAVGACENSVIPAESVRLQIAGVVRQELRGPVALAILSEVVDIIGKLGRADVDPEPPLVASPFFAPQHCHRCVIGPDHRSLPHQFFLEFVEGPKQVSDVTNPIAERAA